MTKKEMSEKKPKVEKQVESKVETVCKQCEQLKEKIEQLKAGTKKDKTKKDKTEKELEQLEKRKVRNQKKRDQFEKEQLEREKKYETIQNLNIELQQKILHKN
jgi:hypothetical protein